MKQTMIAALLLVAACAARAQSLPQCLKEKRLGPFDTMRVGFAVRVALHKGDTCYVVSRKWNTAKMTRHEMLMRRQPDYRLPEVYDNQCRRTAGLIRNRDIVYISPQRNGKKPLN